MKDSLKYILSLFIVSAFNVSVEAQDIHYSQMYSTPLYFNPAFTGNHQCDYRAGVNYRQQAASFTIPFTTYSAWGDTKVTPAFLRNRGWIGLGANLYYDNAGNGDLKKVQGMFFTAYSQGFNSDNSLYGSLGIGLGVTNRSVNKESLIYGDQWNTQMLGFNLDKISPDITNITNPSIFYLDFNLGLSVHHYVNDKWLYEVGGSISHVNRPHESFYPEYIELDDGTILHNTNRVGMKYIVHGTAQHILSEMLLLKPEVYFIAHEGVQETLLGSNLVYGYTDLRLVGGLWYRWGRDIIPALGLEYSGFTMLFTYDINISEQRRASNYQGGFEFSLVKRFCYRGSTKRQPCKFLEF
ncbi:MAG: PorP/SprF family type IX secretion system membrane protein [Bacteroidales bacterium]